MDEIEPFIVFGNFPFPIREYSYWNSVMTVQQVAGTMCKHLYHQQGPLFRKYCHWNIVNVNRITFPFIFRCRTLFILLRCLNESAASSTLVGPLSPNKCLIVCVCCSSRPPCWASSRDLGINETSPQIVVFLLRMLYKGLFLLYVILCKALYIALLLKEQKRLVRQQRRIKRTYSFR